MSCERRTSTNFAKELRSVVHWFALCKPLLPRGRWPSIAPSARRSPGGGGVARAMPGRLPGRRRPVAVGTNRGQALGLRQAATDVVTHNRALRDEAGGVI